MRSFLVGGGLVVVDGQLLMAANRRRQGTLEWTPPGGVIDPGESVTEGISREVREETGLHVPQWEAQHYTVTVHAPDMGWEMTVESWFATAAHGSIALNDPDRIVEQAEFVDLRHVEALLADSPPWVRLPITAWLGGGLQPMDAYEFHVYGADRSTARIEQCSP
ncbi:MAG: ADP-ribose pyrophosphatase [Ilumatobacteraceae bacterium]|nr:ADP-ribose pyrophosphatase [Ilumatobacteraceae bacterium]